MRGSKSLLTALSTLALVACGQSDEPAPKATIVVQGQIQALPQQDPAIASVAVTLDGVAVQGSPFPVTAGRFGPVNATVAPGTHTIAASGTDGTATFTATVTLDALAGSNSTSLFLVDTRYQKSGHAVPVVQSITATPAALTVIAGQSPVTPTSTLSASVVSLDPGAALSYAWTDTCGGTFAPADASSVYTPPPYSDGLPKTCTIELTATATTSGVSVSDPVFSKATTTIAVSYVTALTITPATQGYGVNVAGVTGDPAPGFGTGSYAATGTPKAELNFDPTALFGGPITLGDIAGLSYWTKKGTTHTDSPGDWYVNIYTKPYDGETTTQSAWYGQRIGAEPYFAKNLNDPANTWNQWSTDTAENQLRFFESTVNVGFGTYTDPDWATFVQGNSIALTGRPSVPYAAQEVLYISLQTASAWAAGFTGQLDGFEIRLKDGRSATIDFEP